MTKEPLIRALADKIKLPVSVDVLMKLADDGMANISVERNPLRYSRGVTLTPTDGGADRVYVNTYKDALDPTYLLTAP